MVSYAACDAVSCFHHGPSDIALPVVWSKNLRLEALASVITAYFSSPVSLGKMHASIVRLAVCDPAIGASQVLCTKKAFDDRIMTDPNK